MRRSTSSSDRLGGGDGGGVKVSYGVGVSSSSSKYRKRKLNRCLIDELNESLVELGIAANTNSSGGPAAAAADYSSSSPPPRQFYLIYFCSFFTSSNSRQKELFEQIIEFLSYVQEKIECSIRIVLVSSDFLESDYEKLIEKYRDSGSNNYSTNPTSNVLIDL